MVISAAAGGLCLLMPAALAQDDGQQDSKAKAVEGPRCISVNRIGSAKVVDNWTVILDMPGRNKDLQMNLRYECHQLKFHGTFYYRAFGGRLCRNDIITARGGWSCPIKSFTPYVKGDEKKADEDRADPPDERNDETNGAEAGGENRDGPAQ